MLCVIFSIWGCSPSKSSKESSNQQSLNNEVKSDVEKYYQIGEKSSSDLTEIVLKSVEYSKTIPTFLFDPSRGDKTPDEGEFIKVQYSIKIMERKNLVFFSCADGHISSSLIYEMPYVDYNDGYIFTPKEFKVNKVIRLEQDCAYQKDGKYSVTDLGPFDDPIEIEVYIIVPSEVVNNKDNQLLVGFTVPSSSATEKLIYKIR